MNTSISLLGPSRSKRMVEAGRGTTASADMIKLLLMNSSWFETAQARLLTMRDLILRSGLLAASRRMTNSLTRRAGLRLQVRAPVDPRHPRQQIIHFGPCRRGEARPRLALCAGSDRAALLQHIFPHRQSRTRLLLVADQRQMRIEQIMRGIAGGPL